jgi:parvulin-like peptidyl-prolyl isomerase
MINIRLLALEAKREGLDKDPLVQMELREVQREAMLEEARKGSPTPGEIPEAQVRAYFDAHADEYKDPERRRVSLVVLKDEGTAKVVLEAAQKAVAPAAWGELVRGKSIDSQAHANVPLDLAGDFGFVAPPGDSRSESPRVPEAVRVAVFEIPRVGAVLPRVVKGADGLFYVVRLSQISEARTRSFVEAERSIRVKLAQDALRERERKMLDELRTQYKIEVVEDGLSKVAVPSADGGEALPHAHDGPDASSGSPH